MANENLTEIGLVFSEEGYDSLIDKVKKVGQEVERLTKEDEARVVAAAKVSKATASLSDAIDRSIISYAGSKSAILEYKAAQIGASAAMEQQIALLKELEYGTTQQAQAFKGRQQDIKDINGLEQDRVKDMLAGFKQELAAREQIAKQRKSLEVDLAKDLQANAAYEKKIFDSLAADRIKDIQLVAKEQEKARANSAKLDQEVIANLQKVSDQAIALAEKQAIAEISWANKSAKERIAILQQVQQYQANPNISAETTGNKFGSAAIKDAPNLMAMQNAYTKEVHATTEAHGKLAESQKTVSQLWGEVTLNTSRARSEMIVIAHEAVQGRFSRIPASLMVFAEYSNLSAIATSALGLAVLGTVGAVATLIYAVAKGQIEFTKLNASLITTGGYSGLTTSSFTAMAGAMTKTHGTIGQAREGLMALAESGRFTRSQIETIAPAIVDMEHASSQSVQNLVKEFEKLAKDPVAASKELNSQYHYLTGAIYEQITALKAQGNELGAVDLAEKEFAKASGERATQILGQLGLIERGWNFVTRAISGGWDAAKSMGRPSTTQDLINDAVAEREKLQRATSGEVGKFSGKSPEQIEELKAINGTIFKLTRQAENEEYNAQNKSQVRQLQQDDIAAQDRLKATEKSMYTNEQKRQDASAKIFQDAARINAGALEAAGVKMYEIEQANARKILPSNADLPTILAAAKDRNDKIIALAKEHGVNLAITEERIARDLRNIQEKKQDKPIQGASFVDLEKFVQSQEREFQKNRQHADRMIGESNKRYLADKRLAEEDLVVARDNANTKSAIHLTEISVYTDYVKKIKSLNDQLVQDELTALDKEISAGQARTDAIVKKANAQIVKTPEDKLRRNAAIDKAKDSQEALLSLKDDKVGSISSRANSNVAEAESQGYKQSVVEINRLIDATDRRLVQKEREYAAIGLTKARVRELAELEDSHNASKLQAQIAQDKMALSGTNLSLNEIKMYEMRIVKLEELYQKTQRFVELNVVLKARQEDWQAGMVEGFHNYLDTVDNVFASSRKLTEQTFKGMEDALSGFITTGKLNFNSLFATLGAGLARLYIQSKVLGPIADALNGKSSGSSSGGGFLESAISGVGKWLGFGGSSGGGLSNIASSYPLGFASGGSPTINTPYLVGENGPEWHIDRKPSTILPNGQQPAGMGQSIVVNNTFVLQQPADKRTQDQIAVSAGQSIQRAIARNT